jgi:hypothetical protein
LLAAQQAGDDQAARDLEGEWRGRLSRLVSADVAAAKELPGLLRELREILGQPGDVSGVHVEMHAQASDNARVYQAGHDQHVTGS